MADGPKPSGLERMQLSPHDIERRQAFVDVWSDNVTRIATIKDLVVRNADRHRSAFFDHLATTEEAFGPTKNCRLEQARRATGADIIKQHANALQDRLSAVSSH